MQAYTVKGALVKTAFAQLLETTVKLPKDDSDVLQACLRPFPFPFYFRVLQLARAVSLYLN